MSNFLKTYRVRAGLSQRELAQKCGWLDSVGRGQQSRVGNYEKLIRQPSLADCRAIVRILNEREVLCALDDVFPDPQDIESDVA